MRPTTIMFMLTAMTVMSVAPSRCLRLCAQEPPSRMRSNFTVLDSLSTRLSQQLVRKTEGTAIASLMVHEHPGRWLVKDRLQQALRFVSSPSARSLDVRIVECGVLYRAGSDKDSLNRMCRIELRAGHADSTLFDLSEEYVDVIARRDVIEVEVPRHEFTTASIPPPRSSVWDEIMEPLIIVAALATTVVLLFSVRSQ